LDKGLTILADAAGSSVDPTHPVTA
ncbi:MAG: hypothetical protein QOG57_5042, partial [Pseudonocardiales bacterium]|nr:hypothetical protein [Pseudonocardiales bacterium]